MRRPIRASALAAVWSGVLALAACGNGSTPASHHSPAPSAAPRLQPGEDPLPATDTPIDQAPAALAAAWKQYGVTLIPGHQSLDAPPAPVAADRSGGAFTAAQVQAIGQAVLRDQVLSAWIDEHDQVSLLPRAAGEPFLLGGVGVALAEGTRVHTPPCGVLPSQLAVHAPDPSVIAALAAFDHTTVDPTAVLVEATFAGPCEITGTTRDGRTVHLQTIPPGFHVVIAAALHSDPLLGSIAYPEAAGLCSDPRFGQACA